MTTRVTVRKSLVLFVVVLFITTTVQADLINHTKFQRFFAAQNVPSDGADISGSSAKLTRGESAVWLRANTTNLLPGAYTIWWAIFNNPAACTDPCNTDDLFNLTQRAAVQSSVVYATGGFVGDNGVGHFSAFLETGVLPTGPGQVGFGPGLQDPQNAVIHLLLRYHGPVNPDPVIMQKQISHIAGGCVNLAPMPGQPGNDPVMEHRIFPCYDIQTAVFIP